MAQPQLTLSPYSGSENDTTGPKTYTTPENFIHSAKSPKSGSLKRQKDFRKR